MKARLISSEELAPLTRHFTFETDQDLQFVPGQFLSLVADVGGRQITRAYSIASPPAGNRFDLCLNLVEDGTFSPVLFGMEPGDEVEYKGPYGVFVFRNPPADSILVATGTGITPFRSMLQERLPKEPARQFTLVFGARHEHGLLYRAEFERLAAEYPNFRFIPTLTRPTESWTGRTGRIHGPVAWVLGDRRDMDVYICGLAEMVNELRTALKEIGLDRKRIIAEKYD
jgi:CDP-4-dehydro-6-deoxyglucose reductase